MGACVELQQPTIGQTSFDTGPERAGTRERSPWRELLLAIITFDLYLPIWYLRVQRDLHDAISGRTFPDGGTVTIRPRVGAVVVAMPFGALIGEFMPGIPSDRYGSLLISVFLISTLAALVSLSRSSTRLKNVQELAGISPPRRISEQLFAVLVLVFNPAATAYAQSHVNRALRRLAEPVG